MLRRASTIGCVLACALWAAGCDSDSTNTPADGGVQVDSSRDGAPPAGDGPSTGDDGQLGDGAPPPGDGSPSSDQGPAPSATSPLGTGISGIADWSSEYTFVDAFKASRKWISGSTSGTWDDGRSFDLDANGWVKSLKTNQIARTLLFWELKDRYPKGRYVVLYRGKGTIEYWSSATKDTAASSPGRDVIDVDPSKGGIGLTITAVDSSDHLREIRVIMPGGVCSDDPYAWCEKAAECAGAGASCESFEQNYATQIFHPTFLSRVESYRLLRFMDWMDTNNSKIKSWSERPKIDDARWSTHGVPFEVMIALANRLRVDAWFNMPHLADDTYVSEAAKLVAATLDKPLKAYVEYSNEVWNGQFAQATYARQQGKSQGLSQNDFEAQLFFFSRRSVEVFKLWRAAFGADKDRVVRVMAAQAGNAWVAEQVLGHNNAAADSDALAIAPYFGGYLGGPSEQSRVSKMSLADLFKELKDQALPKVATWLKDNADAAKKHKVALIAYEGGQHLAGHGGVENDATINKLFDDANRDPRMKQLYLDYLAAWKSAGGELFVHFVNCGRYSKWGRWGALEYLDQPRQDSPKFDALQTFISQNPKWW